jgi:TetR/AcrR family transcriptional regulator, transcriptional repressor for nem operon
MGRKREFDEDRMLAVIRDQFWSRGYEATSTYDLMEATGLGKGSIYKAYGNKHELFLRTFSDYCDDIVVGARAALSAEAGSSPVKRIEAYLLALADVFACQSPRIGCYLTKATVDLAAIDDAVAEIARCAYENIAGAFEAAVREAQSAGEVDREADAGAQAFLMLAVIRGMDCLARTGVEGSVLRRTVRAALVALGNPR